MTKLCYVCNEIAHTWYQNLLELELQHSNISVCTFLKRFLGTVDSNRKVEDDSNCICEECCYKICDYDLTQMLAVQKENEIQDLFLSTEQLYAGNIVNNLKTEQIEISEDPLNEPSLENIKNEVESISMDFCDTNDEMGVIEQEISEDAGTISESEDTNSCGNISMEIFFERAELDCFEQEAPEENGNCFQDLLEAENGGKEEEEGMKEVEGKEEEEGKKEVEGKEEEGEEEEGEEEYAESNDVEHIELYDDDEDDDDEENNVHEMNAHSGLSTHPMNHDHIYCTPTVIKVLPKCPICDIKMKNPEAHQRWHKKRHPGFVCRICFFKCRDKEALLSHTKLHENRSKFQCLWCAESFERPIDSKRITKLRQHVRTKHMIPSECLLCAEKIPTKKVEVHSNFHKRNPGFVCRICLFKLNDLEALVSHRKLHDSRPMEECVVCGKVFERIKGVRSHMSTHIDERNIMCDLCGKVFTTKARLQIHRNIHTNEKVWECQLCPKIFNASTNHKIHMDTVHGTARPFTCSICDMKFKRKDQCRVHERRHTENTKTEKCTICPAAYEHKFHLKQHMERKHRTESPKSTKKRK